MEIVFKTRRKFHSKVLNVHSKLLNAHSKLLNRHSKLMNEDFYQVQEHFPLKVETNSLKGRIIFP